MTSFLRRLFGSSSNMSSSAVLESIQSEISANQVVIYSKTYCPYCTATKTLFSSKFPNLESKSIVELDTIANGSEVQQALLSMTGQRTVPNVFVNGKHLGGNDDTQAAFSSGRLQQMLKVES